MKRLSILMLSAILLFTACDSQIAVPSPTPTATTTTLPLFQENSATPSPTAPPAETVSPTPETTVTAAPTAQATTAKPNATVKPTAKPTVKPSTAPPKTKTSTETVYITKTGEKYHRNGCQYLRKSKIAIDKSKAIAQGYSACSKCY